MNEAGPARPAALQLPGALAGDWNTAYAELKAIARARLYQADLRTHLNTTALVNEAYLRLAGSAAALEFPSPQHFFAYAAKVMRSVIVDLVRERQAERRGGGLERVTLDTLHDTALGDNLATGPEPLQVDAALQALAQVEPRLAQVVELRYFAGLTEPETAQVLGLNERTVRRDWHKARLLLKAMLV